MRLLVPTLICAMAFLLPVAIAAPSEDDSGDSFSMPSPSWFGLCNAYEHNANGREHGNAGNAPPFAWLADQADSNETSVSGWCANNTAHPGNSGK